MKMESKIDQNDYYFFGNLEIQFQIQNFKLALLFFKNFTVDFQNSYFREKKNSRTAHKIYNSIDICYSKKIINNVEIRTLLFFSS